MKTTRCLELALLLVAALMPQGICRAELHTSEVDTWIDRALHWLPQGTETVIVARGPYSLSNVNLNQHTSNPTLSSMLQGWSLSQLPWKDSEGAAISGVKVLLSLEGSRGFRRPADLGLMPYNGIHVVVFSKDVKAQISRALTKDQRSTVRIHGQPVEAFTRRTESDIWHYYVAFPMPRVLLIATDRASMDSALQRIAHPSNPALRTSLPEWAYVDRKAAFWALRHYDRKRGYVDGTQPFASGNQVFGLHGETDPSAQGLTFSFDPRSSTSAYIRYISSNPNAEHIAEPIKASRDPGLPPIRTKRLTRQAFQITFVEAEQHGPMSSFYLLFWLGHGIAL